MGFIFRRCKADLANYDSPSQTMQIREDGDLVGVQMLLPYHRPVTD